MVIKASPTSSSYILNPWIPSYGTIIVRRVAVRITVSDPFTWLHSSPSKSMRSVVFWAVYGELSDPLFGAVPKLSEVKRWVWGDILTHIARSSPDQNPPDIVWSTLLHLRKIWLPSYGEMVAKVREELVRRRDLQKRYLWLIDISSIMVAMSENALFGISEFDIFPFKLIQLAVVVTTEVKYEPID